MSFLLKLTALSFAAYQLKRYCELLSIPVLSFKHMGAHVIGTVSTEEKAKTAQEAGADDIIIYTKQDFVAETKRLTNGVGANYIIDGVGKSTLTKDLEAVRTRGCICIIYQWN